MIGPLFALAVIIGLGALIVSRLRNRGSAWPGNGGSADPTMYGDGSSPGEYPHHLHERHHDTGAHHAGATGGWDSEPADAAGGGESGAGGDSDGDGGGSAGDGDGGGSDGGGDGGSDGGSSD